MPSYLARKPADAMHNLELVSMFAPPIKALHQLVGDVIVLREELPGDVERNGFRSVVTDHL